jgi:aerobic-type carbon monoxide dehydrogenase small subunit (CoxS/CutS family)
MDSTHPIRLTVNGRDVQGQVSARLLLADFLRGHLGLTGTHIGCEHGVCGACTVSVNGEAVRSCLMLAVHADGVELKTVEGLSANDGQLHPLQIALREHHALQCGFCTSGVLMSLAVFLEKHPNPNEAEIRDVVSGHICRCTGYQGMVAAGLAASGKMADQRGA